MRQRALQIVQTLFENYLKWEAAHKRGSSLCKSIENVKRPVLTKTTETDTLYPDEMISLCEKLKIITTIFDDILSSATESCRQLKTIDSNIDNNNKFFRTWPMSKVLKSVEIIMDAYRHDFSMKLMVMENIAHSRDNAELIQNISIWDHLRHVNEDVRLQFKMLCYECNISSNKSKT